MADEKHLNGFDSESDNYDDELNQPTVPQSAQGAQKAGLPSPEEFDDDETSDYEPAQAAKSAPVSDDEPPADDDDVPFKLPNASEISDQPTLDNRNDPHKMLTMPVFKEPGVTDPKKTLVGTGGLDPNPDMDDWRGSGADKTVQNLRAVPPADADYPSVQRPEAGYTMQNPNVADNRFQRPPAPVPPVAGQRPLPHGQQQGLPKGRASSRRRRRILGLPSGCVYLFIGLIVSFCGGITLLTGAAAAVFIPQIESQWEAQITKFEEYTGFQSTFIKDRYGNDLFEVFGEGRRTRVPYERFPTELILATIAVEDDTFFTNIGVDVGATLVATLQFFGSDSDETPGGSTITQQIVRNVLFDFEKRAERSVQRKAEEIILAVLITQRRSKEDILELYLNEIYYGNLAYGAQTAAQTFFGKDVEDLTLGEAALLAGLPQAPASLDPLNPDPEVQARVEARWRLVLDLMVSEGFITPEERTATINAGLSFAAQTTSLRAPHFTVYAQGELERLMEELGYPPETLAQGGYTVYTTVDQTINTMAQNTARDQVAGLAQNNISNAAVLVTKPLTGEILAMVGSIDYNSNVIDGRVNVTTAFRQPGSTMKPFTYSAALERGMTPGTVIWDTRTDIGIPGQPMYSPVNYDRTFHGPMTMRRALANSYNIPAVQTLRLVGVDYLLQFLRRFGVESLRQDASLYGLSLTLGGGEITLVELVNGYSVFANQGAYVPVTSILCIVNSDGNIIYQYENGCPTNAGRFTNSTVDRTGYGVQVLDPRIAFLMTDIMSDNQARAEAMGTNSALVTPNIESAVKTGTTNDIKDNWTVGYTRNLAIGVWVGNNNGDPMRNSSGLTGAAPIWNRVFTGIYNDSRMREALRVGGQFLPDRASAPGGMSRRQICNVRNLTDPSANCNQVTEWFLDGPAGIPDAQGNLQFPQQPQIQQPDPEGGVMQEVSPGVYQAVVYRLPENIAAGISYQLGAGEKQPLPPRYCNVPQSQVNNAPGAQQLLFVAGPVTSAGDWVEAQRYAYQNNIAILPNITCWPEVYSAPQFQGGDGVVAGVISSPVNGQVINTTTPIIGTAQWQPGQVDFYHLYIQGGPFGDWTPLGNPGTSPVTNGQLEVLQPEGLPAGTYRLRLALVRGGDFVAAPYEMSFVKE